MEGHIKGIYMTEAKLHPASHVADCSSDRSMLGKNVWRDGGGVLCSENLGGREFTSVRIQGMHYSKESHEVLNNLILAMKKLFYGDSQPVGPNPL